MIEIRKPVQIVHPRGVEEYVARLVENKTLVHPKPIMIKGTRDKIIVEIGLHYNDSYNEQLLCYTNAVPNPDGGTHSSGFRGSLTRAINQYAKNNSLLKEKDVVAVFSNGGFDRIHEKLLARLKG